MSLLLNSLEYVQKNIDNCFDEHNIILRNEIKRIIDSKDIYYINSLKKLVRRECEELIWGYYKHYIKNSENETYNCEENIIKKEELFWKSIHNISCSCWDCDLNK